ncbi:MAG: hypothetical protein NTV86_15060 [Planctomycetota bacterium]|nr:hypothetical protein [Planctomycetota bacterium]
MANVVNLIAWNVWDQPRQSPQRLCDIQCYYQKRNRASYESRRRRMTAIAL